MAWLLRTEGPTRRASKANTDITPLQQLDQKIQSDATGKQAAQDFSTIFSDYRVYVLVPRSPRTRQRLRGS
jgi:hypothetical protein